MFARFSDSPIAESARARLTARRDILPDAFDQYGRGRFFSRVEADHGARGGAYAGSRAGNLHAGCFIDGLPSLRGLRMHYLDEGPRTASRDLALPAWQPAMELPVPEDDPVFLAAGHRVVAPDMPGFGKSDKPIDDAAHSLVWHRSVLLELIEHLQLTDMNPRRPGLGRPDRPDLADKGAAALPGAVGHEHDPGHR